ncbi:fatty acid desaturase [Rhizopus microsporus ATCC 52813]|uniref:Fatty acid desaturase n=1 Tax=Rhizopus microsporus ATCC 52813 TaxID=1340429 RepID=A0A2G4SUD2_RHIZD|nr:fatty acid desaturase [Rhizopus microsporus ATCC 52813]PHZ12370.1 fatty acid desaturase [Rhizopus microsporus ATCC 52813]
MDEPHLKRKHALLAKYPEIRQLYGSDFSTFYAATVINLVQLGLAYYFGHYNSSHWTMILAAYFIGGTMTGIVGVIIHEACHNLITGDKTLDRIMGLYTNLALPVPISQSFRRYHIEHHTWQGVEGRDPDLPLEWEKKWIRGSAWKKCAWILIYPVMYVARGAILQQRWGHTPKRWEWINLAVTVLANVFVQRIATWRGLFYLFISLWCGYSLHPGAAHFIQEHYAFDDGQETYSYYGVLNIPFMNIGYHNEHHDFQMVPWSRLPHVRALATEYYDSLAYHTSWLLVHWKFIFDPAMGPQSRVVRDYDTFKSGRSLLKKIHQLNRKND